MQASVVVGDDDITGTLKYLDSGQLVTDWGAGNFMALEFSDIDSDAVKVMVGLDPSVSSGLVDVLPDPDKNGVFKVTDKDAQKFVVIQYTADGLCLEQEFDLSGLTCQTS